MIKSIRSQEEYRQLKTVSNEKPVFLLKHSTACSVSSIAKGKFVKFAEKHPEAGYYQVLVIEDRPLSREIATDTEIEHHSPQAILFKDGKGIWQVTHYAVNEDELAGALKSRSAG